MWERVIEQRLKQDLYYRKSILFIIWEVDNGSNILATIIDGVIFEK